MTQTMKPPRKPIPETVKLAACLIRCGCFPEQAIAIAEHVRDDPQLRIGRVLANVLAALGFEGESIEWDHSPPLALRDWIQLDEGEVEYIPPANDPRHIYPMKAEDHRRKTSGAAPGEGKAHVADSDQHKIAKVDRLLKRQGLERVGELKTQPGGAVTMVRKAARWPKGRRLQSRNNLRKSPT